MSGVRRSGVYGLGIESIKVMDSQTVNTAQVFKAVERDSSFFLADSGPVAKHQG